MYKPSQYNYFTPYKDKVIYHNSLFGEAVFFEKNI